MSKSLEDMSLKELWQLFPIFLVNHNEEWLNWYKEEKNLIVDLLPDNLIKRISHIGSTAIKDVQAKNIVDILLEVDSLKEMETIKKILLANNWRCMSQSDNRISLNKGYTTNGFDSKVYHLHLRLLGDNDELYFRDYLREHSKTAKKYEALKLDLADKYKNNRDKYTDSKGEFIKKYTELAKKEYKDRY